MGAPSPPAGPLWLHEIKNDGLRVIARKDGRRVQLYSREGDDLTKRFPLIAETMARLPSCTIDGEAVACDDSGNQSFDLLRRRQRDDQVFLYAFDLIELDGKDRRRDPLDQRKADLGRLLSDASPGILFNGWIDGGEFDGAVVFEHACELGFAGIVSKRKDSRYVSGRSPYWLQTKNPASEAIRRYGRFIGADVQEETGISTRRPSPTDAETRIKWLGRQRAQDLTKDFKPRPWEQLTKVLRNIGHQDGAKKVAIAKRQRIVKSKRLARVLHPIYGVLRRYGYRPGWLIAWAIGVALLWSGLFKIAANLGVMAPTDWRVIADTTDPGCRPERGGNWTTCQSLHHRGYRSFDPVVYSFDLILPVIATEQTKDWAPSTTEPCQRVNWLGFCKEPLADGGVAGASGYWWPGLIFWLLARLETLAGWAFGLTFVAIVSGLIKKKKSDRPIARSPRRRVTAKTPNPPYALKAEILRLLEIIREKA